MTRLMCVMALAAATGMASAWAVSSMAAVENAAVKTADSAKPAALNFTVKDIDGKDVDLSTYAGKVVLVVNVASKCGNTPQYKGLEEMYTKYKDQGLVILGFPANNFGAQEPGTEADIKKFCMTQYSVTFPMFSKISVKGEDMAPLYKYLTALDAKPKGKGDVKWNFEKFLIARDGTVAGRFDPATKPEDPKLVAAVEAAIKK